jgi:Bacterial regulatory proteins, tetR family
VRRSKNSGGSAIFFPLCERHCGDHQNTKTKLPSPEAKEKRKAGTRAGLTRPAIAAAAKLIESAGVNEFSLRRLAKDLGVGPTTIHFHFKGAGGGIYAAIVVRALARVTRPFKPKEVQRG